MLKLDAATANRRSHQCDYCPVRRTGLCSAFADNNDPGLADLQEAHMPVRQLDAGETIFSQGDPADHVYHVVSGWVDLHQDMPDGRRQISEFLLPGPLFGIEPRGARRLQGATAITTGRVCAIPSASIVELRRTHHAFNERYIDILERDKHDAAESLTMLGQGNSIERLARILWGLAKRMAAPGLVFSGMSLKAPITQRLLAEATGLTTIHVNRVLRRLREQHLLELRDGILLIEDPARLAALANEIENPAYPTFQTGPLRRPVGLRSNAAPDREGWVDLDRSAKA